MWIGSAKGCSDPDQPHDGTREALRTSLVFLHGCEDQEQSFMFGR